MWTNWKLLIEAERDSILATPRGVVVILVHIVSNNKRNGIELFGYLGIDN